MTTMTDPEVALLQALAEPNRLAIVRKLAQEGEAGAGEFTACCEVAQPTISHHLKVLREAGVVATSRRGTSIRYRLHPDAIRRLAALLGGLIPAELPWSSSANEAGPMTGSQPPDELPT